MPTPRTVGLHQLTVEQPWQVTQWFFATDEKGEEDNWICILWVTGRFYKAMISEPSMEVHTYNPALSGRLQVQGRPELQSSKTLSQNHPTKLAAGCCCGEDVSILVMTVGPWRLTTGMLYPKRTSGCFKRELSDKLAHWPYCDVTSSLWTRLDLQPPRRHTSGRWHCEPWMRVAPFYGLGFQASHPEDCSLEL